jgi:hypothetical protein
MIAAKVRHLDLSLNDKSRIEFAKETKVSSGYIGQAAIVLKWAADQVDSVISGAITLNDAYKEAQDRKRAVESEECKMQRLRQDAPDLAALVGEDRMSLAQSD